MRKRSLNGRIFWGFRVARTLAMAKIAHNSVIAEQSLLTVLTENKVR